MGEAKRRKALDPDFGKNKLFIQLMYEKYKNKPKSFYPFLVGFLKWNDNPILLIDGSNGGAIISTPSNLSELPSRISQDRKQCMLNSDTSKVRFLVLASQSHIGIFDFSPNEISESLEWIKKNLNNLACMNASG